MNTFNFKKLNNLSEFSISKMKLETDEEAHIAITGFIEVNAQNNNVLVKLLNELPTMVPKASWFEYFFRCCKYVYSSENYDSLINKSREMVLEIKSAKLAAEVFAQVEQLYVNNDMTCCGTELLEKSASKAYQLTHDVRYMLFRDYAYLYTSNDEETLAAAVNDLADHLSSSICKEDQRCVFYLLSLALKKLAKSRNRFIISETVFAELHEYCRELKFQLRSYDDDDDIHLPLDFGDWHDADDYRYGRFDILTLIFKYNCPEVINIFNCSDSYYDGASLKQLNETVHRVIEENKYSSEKLPIIFQKFVFLSEESSDPIDTEPDDSCYDTEM